MLEGGERERDRERRKREEGRGAKRQVGYRG